MNPPSPPQKDGARSAAVDIILASGSPRRKDLLGRMSLRLAVQPPDIDESPLENEPALDHVRRLAKEKAEKVAEQVSATDGHPGVPILAADTIVELDGRIFGKAPDEAGAAVMLDTLAGRRHNVHTAYHVLFGDNAIGRLVTTQVAIRLMSPGEKSAYLASGEWKGKAGSYAIQGTGAAFVTEIHGSVTNVMGLPLAEVLADLQATGALANYPPSAFVPGA